MKKGQGFSLIEIAIVLVVLGFLIGSLLHPLAKKVEQDKIKLTQHNLEEIKQALLGYAVLHGCLPCPAVDTAGGEVREKVDVNICSQSCKDSAAVNEGFIPWLDLGVGRYDAWGNQFRYRVKEKYTNSAELAPGITSSLLVKDTQIINTPDGPKENKLTVSDTVVAIIFSYGPNRTSEQPGYQTYIQEGYLENQFDDILTWLSENTVNDYLIAAGKKNYALTTMKKNNEFSNQIMNSYLSN